MKFTKIICFLEYFLQYMENPIDINLKDCLCLHKKYYFLSKPNQRDENLMELMNKMINY